MVLTGFLSFFLPAMVAVDPTCNYYRNMEVGITYYIYNKGYPDYYSSPIECLWKAVAPNGYQIEVNCDLEIPQVNIFFLYIYTSSNCISYIIILKNYLVQF